MERCRDYFIRKNAHFLLERIQEFAESSATVELAAVRLNCEPARIAKSLSFLQKRSMSKAEMKASQKALTERRKQQQQAVVAGDGAATPGNHVASPPPPSDATAIVIVAAGDAKVSTAKYKAKFACQPKMLKREEVESFTGFPPGAVCPFALKEDVRVYLDMSLRRFPYVYPAVGTTSSGIRVTLDELEQYASNVVEWVDLCDGWAPTAKEEEEEEGKEKCDRTAAVKESGVCDAIIDAEGTATEMKERNEMAKMHEAV